MTVSGNPSGRGAGAVRNGCRVPAPGDKAGRVPHQGCSQPWQRAPSSRSPPAAAQSSMPTGRVWRAASSAATRARQSVDSHPTTQIRGHVVPIASSGIRDGADLVIEERLPLVPSSFHVPPRLPTMIADCVWGETASSTASKSWASPF